MKNKTLKEIIELADELNPNSYSDDIKAQWVNEVETYIQTEIFCVAPLDVVTYFPYEDNKGKELSLDFTNDKIYLTYLQAMIDFSNKEYTAFNNDVALYNTYLDTYAKWYQRTHSDGAPLVSGMYLSAYGIAVKHGFSGTEEEWIASLKGEKGDTGHGLEIKGYVDDVSELPDGTSGTPSPTIGDVWQAGLSQELYLWNGSEWVYLGTYKGEQGEKGDTGAKGEKGDKGDAGVKNMVDGVGNGSIRLSDAEEVTERHGVALGYGCYSGKASFSTGYNNKSLGYGGAVFGTRNEGDGWGVVVGGQDNIVNGAVNAVFGSDNNVQKTINFVTGQGNAVNGDKNNVIGTSNGVTGNNNFVSGKNIKAYTDNNIMIGNAMSGVPSGGFGGVVAIGNTVYAQFDDAVVLGNALVAGAKGQVVLGSWNAPNGKPLVIGCGKSGARKNALEVDDGGNAKFSGTVTDGSGNVLGAISTGELMPFVVDGTEYYCPWGMTWEHLKYYKDGEIWNKLGLSMNDNMHIYRNGVLLEEAVVLPDGTVTVNGNIYYTEDISHRNCGTYN